MRFILLLFSQLLLQGSVRAQFPFEKFPSIPFREYKKWKSYSELNPQQLNFTNSIPAFFPNKNGLILEVEEIDSLTFSTLRIYRNNLLIQKLRIEDSFYVLSTPMTVFVEDLNNDGLSDIKFTIPNHGSGAFNYYARVIFLIQQKDGTFKKLIFTDCFSEEFGNRPERDLDGDGTFEIITETFQNVGNHNYWMFNIYNYEDGSFVNVNDKANYPILVPLETYNESERMPKSTMKKYSRKLPDDFVN